ncbi:magnesium transporter CorA family protein [Candidatus Uhrbacteria bacterium]|nr:magnesium transporter CorA family protein [Candidatus Uhrbacteria bacterium]
MHTRELTTPSVRWVNVTRPEKRELAYLAKEFKFHPLDLEDCASPAQRPKLVEYPQYLFLVLIFPLYDRKTMEVVPAEIDFFISEKYVVTVHRSELFPFMQFFDECRKDLSLQHRVMASADQLLYEILERLLAHTFPMLDHVSVDISRLQKEIFAGNENQFVREILSTRRNIVTFRRIMQAHKAIIRRVEDKGKKFFKGKGLTFYFDNLVDHTKDIWDALENQKDSIEALKDTNEALVSFQLNNIMKLLTIISVVMLPAGLIANIFSTNAHDAPIIGLPGDFWILIGLMTIVGVTMLAFFHKKKWL